MAEAVVENRPLPVRFFCHKCNIELEHVLQDYTCPFCSGGFIEKLEDNDTITDTGRDSTPRISGGTRPNPPSADETNDIDMATSDDSEEFLQTDESKGDRWANWQPPWNRRDDSPRIEAPHFGFGNDLAFLMYNNQISPVNISGSESRLLQMVQQLTGAVSGLSSPLLVVGAGGTGGPNSGDYVVSGEGLDAVMSQLLWQVESEGPPPLAREAIARLPEVQVTAEQEGQSVQCSVCWEAFIKDEKVRELSCGHLYHQGCITPWLSLHATCPICRKSLAPPAPDGGRAATPGADLGTPPGLALLFRACGVPFPQPSTSTTTSTTSATTQASNVTTTAANSATNLQSPNTDPSVTWSTPETSTSRIIRPVISLLRSISQPASSNPNSSDSQRSRPPPSNYDMDLEFD